MGWQSELPKIFNQCTGKQNTFEQNTEERRKPSCCGVSGGRRREDEEKKGKWMMTQEIQKTERTNPEQQQSEITVARGSCQSVEQLMITVIAFT